MLDRRVIWGGAGGLALLAIGLWTWLSRPPAYVIDGETIRFAESPATKAVVLGAALDVGNIPALIEGLAMLEASPLLGEHNIVLLRALPAGSSRQLRRAAALVAERSGGRESPVYRNDDIDLVLVNEFIVRFAPGVDARQAELVLAAHGARIRDENPFDSSRFIVELGAYDDRSPRDIFSAVSSLNADPLIISAEPNFVLVYPRGSFAPSAGNDVGAVGGLEAELLGLDADTPLADTALQNAWACTQPANATDPNDPYFCHQWGLRNDNDPTVDTAIVEAWGKSTGTGVSIAVLDLGVADHPDLPAAAQSIDIVPTALTTANPHPWDSHGTLVAGVAAARFKDGIGIAGAAPEVDIVKIRIGYTGTTTGVQAKTAWIQDGVLAAIAADAEVILSSMYWDDSSKPLTDLLSDAANDRVLVFAAGNGGGGVDYPARLAGTTSTIAVGASNKSDVRVPGTNVGSEVTVAAPGIDLWTTDIPGAAGAADQTGPSMGDHWNGFRGTSGAAPFVAGVAALLASAYPAATPSDIKTWIAQGADKHGLVQPGYGYGRLSATGAFDQAEATLIELVVELPGERLGFGEQKQVLAILTKNGVPQQTNVTFASDSPSRMAIATAQPTPTDATGRATIFVTGETRFYGTANVSATAAGQTAEAPVKVPVSPLWVVVCMAGCILVLRNRACFDAGVVRLLRICAMVTILLTVALVDRQTDVLERLLMPLTDATVAIVALVLSTLGLAVTQAGHVLQSPGAFAYEITHHCAGLWPIMLFACFCWAAPRRNVGVARLLARGLVILLALNILRLTNLFAIGASVPVLFKPMHDLAWPLITALSMSIYWAGAGRRAARLGHAPTRRMSRKACTI